MSSVCLISPFPRKELGYCPISPLFQETERCESPGSESSLGKYCPISPIFQQSERCESGGSESSLGKYCPVAPIFQQSERCESRGLERSESLGKYCPTSPLYEQLEGCGSNGSNFLAKHCSIGFGEEEEEALRPDSPGTAASATHSPCLKRRHSDMECDSGFDRPKKKRMTVKSYLKCFVPIQDQISDDEDENEKEEEEEDRPDSPGLSASTTHSSSLNRPCLSGDNGGDFVSSFPSYRYYVFALQRERNKKKKKIVAGPRPRKKITPIAAAAPPTLAKDSHHLTKLKDLMLKWGKLEEDQSRLDRNRVQLIQEHAQLMASLT